MQSNLLNSNVGEALLFGVTILARPVLLWPFLVENNFFLFQFSFFKTVEDFLLIFNKFISTLHKKYKFKHIATVFLFGYSSPGIDKIKL